MEYVPGGDLGSMINKYGKLQEEEVRSISSQLLDALKYLHEKGITHRDVKPDNILIHNNRPWHVKLTDFGLSKMVDSEETFLRTFCGTLLYCAPEVYSEYREYDHMGARTLRGVDKKLLPPQRYDHAVDIWSLAGVLFFAMCANPPYPVKNGISYQELLNIIMTQPLDIRPLQKVGISDHGIRFIRQMLHVRPEYRATIEELEASPWLTGASVDTEEMSVDEYDEVDLVDSGSVDPELEEGASQLSIHAQNDDDMEFVSDLTEMPPYTGPVYSSAGVDDSNGGGPYEFTQRPDNGRLFGEVDSATLGSSGVIPLDHLPVPNHRKLSHPGLSSSPASAYFKGEIVNKDSMTQILDDGDSDLTSHMPPTQRPDVKITIEGDRANRSSSLMGAESMVGNLHMHSSGAISPPPVSPGGGVSLRRQYEDITDDDNGLDLGNVPSKKPRKSIREIDMIAPQQLFWDPKDKTTHHHNYPQMTIAEFNTYQELAKKRGEPFEHGHTTFDATLQSFLGSRSPSTELDAARAHSEPATDTGTRRDMMKRDERKLSAGEVEGAENRSLSSRDRSLAATAHGSNEPSPRESEPSVIIASHGVVGNDFQPPKPILGKIIATEDSCLPTISLNITESVTSWGRGAKNTVRYSNVKEVRVPKYAFKIFGFKHTDAWKLPPHGLSFDTKDLVFYVSTKASMGITVNNIQLDSNDPQNPDTPSRNWGKLYHGDIITVWQHDRDKAQFTRFRFECYHGPCKERRPITQPFALLPAGDLLSTLETYSQNHERIALERQAILY